MDIATQTEVKKNRIQCRPLATSEQDKMDTLLAFTMTKAAFFADLLLGNLDIKICDDMFCAATDGWAVYLKPQKLFTYTLDEQCFVVCHEVMHCVLRHPAMMAKFRRLGHVPTASGKNLKYDPDLFNRAADYVINAMLIWAAKSPNDAGQAITGRKWKFNREWLYDPQLSQKGEEAVIEVYEKMLNKEPPKGRRPGDQPGGQPGNQPGPGGFDVVLEPPDDKQGQGGADDGSESQEEIKWKVAVAGAADRAKQQGKLPASLTQFCSEYISPEVPWEDKIRTSIHRTVGTGDYDFTRGERRLLCRHPDPIFFPSPSGNGCGLIVVGFDTSGSIEPELPYFMGGITDILKDLNPEKIVIMFCDAKVQRVDTVTDVEDMKIVEQKGIPGRGGTSFIPVFEKVEEMGLQPEALVYFTDMLGSFPSSKPGYPVIWASTTEKVGPFGETVRCKVKF